MGCRCTVPCAKPTVEQHQKSFNLAKAGKKKKKKGLECCWVVQSCIFSVILPQSPSLICRLGFSKKKLQGIKSFIYIWPTFNLELYHRVQFHSWILVGLLWTSCWEANWEIYWMHTRVIFFFHYNATDISSSVVLNQMLLAWCYFCSVSLMSLPSFVAAATHRRGSLNFRPKCKVCKLAAGNRVLRNVIC